VFLPGGVPFLFDFLSRVALCLLAVRHAASGQWAMTQESEDTRREFPATQWTLVREAGTISTEAGFRALEQLLALYLPALRVHLIRMKRLPPDRANDILQGFVARKVLQEKLVGKAKEGTGRFRTYVLTCLNRYFISELRRGAAKKRSPGEGMIDDIDNHAYRLAAPDTERSSSFDVAWGRQVIQETIRRLREECERTNRGLHYKVLECRLLIPIFNAVPPPSYAQLAEELGLRSPLQASNKLVTAKRMLAGTLRAVVAEYCDDDEGVENELAELRAILAGDRNQESPSA
jgi:DNA-directed RNA polymerase specialized sigma24 family protein